MQHSAEPTDLSEQWARFSRLLRTRVSAILTFAVCLFAVVLIGTALQKKIYQGVALVLIDLETPALLEISTSRDSSTLSDSNYMAYADYFQTQLEIITSRLVAQKVYDNLKLGELKRYSRAKDPVLALLKQVKVKPVKLTRLAKIRALDPSPEQAARIANEFALVFVDENLSRTTSKETLTLIKNEYLKLQSRQAELSKRYKAKFPAMVRLQEQMDQLAQLLEEETAKRLHDGQRYAAGGGEEGKADAVLPSAAGGASPSFMDRLRSSARIASIKPNNVQVVDFAHVSKKPVRPKVVLNLVLGMILGLLGGIATAVGMDLLDNTVKNPEDIEQDSRFTLLGYVPEIDYVENAPQGELSPRQRYQHSILNPHSQATEAYRTLRTSLMYAAEKDKTRTVVVTSAASGEGKTTTTVNMGIALAQLGLKVLVVDADLRRPRIHEIFEFPQSPGLSEYLAGHATFETAIQPTEIPSLWLVTSGLCPPNPAELVGSARMKEFIKSAQEKFDRVIFDAPPMIPVTDAALLAGMAGAIIGIALSGKTPRPALRRLVKLCEDVNAKMLGLILNGVPLRAAATYYGYASYGYGREPKNNGVKPKHSKKIATFPKDRKTKNHSPLVPGKGLS